ncbi:MAG TPA: ATP-binding protein, partial [Candidatus Kapabacteria bacterium]|nr:ATP-binding protein [Candidatus Kapabacteria bacterium]
MSIIGKSLTLTIANDVQFLPTVLRAVNDMAHIQGFTPEDIHRLELGTEEAVANVIKHAFAHGTTEYFSIVITAESLGLRITIFDQGMPFDPEQLPAYSPEEVASTMTSRGLGVFLI